MSPYRIEHRPTTNFFLEFISTANLLNRIVLSEMSGILKDPWYAQFDLCSLSPNGPNPTR